MAGKQLEAGREAWNTFSLTALRRNQPCPYLHLGLQLPELGDNTLMLFNPPSLWYFITAAPAN